MTDPIEDPEGTEGGQGETPQMAQLRQQLKQAQKQAKDNAEAAKRAETAERKLAFAEAGIDIADKRMGYFIKGYDGELEAEAITNAAKEAGFIKAEEKKETGEPGQRQQQQSGQEQQQIPAGEIDAFGQMEAAVAGTPLPGGMDSQLLQGMHEIFQKGGTPEDVGRFLGSHGYPVAEGYQ